jgi:hypothetical protein
MKFRNLGLFKKKEKSWQIFYKDNKDKDKKLFPRPSFVILRIPASMFYKVPMVPK